LAPGSTDFIYAVETTDPGPPYPPTPGATLGSPTGPLGISDVGHDPGFRAGFVIAASDCSSIVTTFTRWSANETDSMQRTGTQILDSRVIHPSTATTGAASLAAMARQDIAFYTVDSAYRHLWKASKSTAVNWQLGFRYANMEQLLNAEQTVAVATGLTRVRTDIDFNGFGLLAGADFERYSCASGMLIYGKGLASLLAGDWRANYEQTNQFGGGVIRNQYEDFHATPILEGEVGLGWMSKKGGCRLTAGYTMSGWHEALTTRSYVRDFRFSELTDSGETMTFSGFVTRAEFRF
jgi:hypothetical protein